MTPADANPTYPLKPMTRAEFAARIFKSDDWVAHNMRIVPHIKIGRTVIFTEGHVAEFLAAHEVKPAIGRTPSSRRSSRTK